MIQAIDVLAAGLFASQVILQPGEGVILWPDLTEDTRAIYRADAAFLVNYLGSSPVNRLDVGNAAKALLATSRGAGLYNNPVAAITAFQQLYPVTRG